MVRIRRYPPLTRHIRAGLLVLVVGLSVWVGVRWWMSTREAEINTGPRPSPQEIAEVRAFEERRRADSIHRAEAYRAQREQWQREKEERRLLREQQQAEYLANRARWDAEKAERATARAIRQARYDSLRQLRPEKLTAGTTINLNTADTLLLQRIPGIGPAYARSIVGYRDRLGGFISATQLTEIEYLPAGIEKWCRVESSTPIRRLALNRATFKELIRHPYLNYEQVKAIVNRRQKMGDLRGWKDLGNSPHFSPRDTMRLSPYVKF